MHLPTTKHDDDTLYGCQGSWTISHQSWLLRCLALGRDFLGLASYIAQVVRGSTMTTNSSKLLEHVLLRVSRGGEPWDSLGRDWTLDQESLSPGGQHCSGCWELLLPLLLLGIGKQLQMVHQPPLQLPVESRFRCEVVSQIPLNIPI